VLAFGGSWVEIFLLLPVFMSIERYVQSLKLNIDSNTNTKNINIVAKLQSKMPIYAEKNMQYAHFAEMCKKCINMRLCGNRIFT